MISRSPVLPSLSISAAVLEAEGGILAGSSKGKIWAEISTTDETEVHRLARLMNQQGCAAANVDLQTTYEAIRISSGNGFAHETEMPVILNGSRDINFTMDLVLKDVSLFNDVAARSGHTLELAPLLQQIFVDGINRFGPHGFSPNIIKRLEQSFGLDVTADGFPAEMTDDEAEEDGYEIKLPQLVQIATVERFSLAPRVSCCISNHLC